MKYKRISFQWGAPPPKPPLSRPSAPPELGIAAELVCALLINAFFTIRSQNGDLGAKPPRK